MYRNRSLVPIATESGTKYREDIVENHLATAFHQECIKLEKNKFLNIESKEVTEIKDMVSKANRKQADFIGKLMIQIYNDAKCLTLAPWNWPARFVASEASNSFSYAMSAESIIPKNIQLQHVNPAQHLELMSCIVEASNDDIKQRINDCLAMSLRVDGSVDRTQLDKIYVLAKIVTKQGDYKYIYISNYIKISSNTTISKKIR